MIKINFSEFKKFFTYTLIGSLLVSALVAIISVLFGSFTEITGRVFWTLAMVFIHSLLSLIFIWDDERQSTFHRLAFFINVLFLIIVFSFLTSIFAIWKFILVENVFKYYLTYLLFGFASLHADILSKVLRKESYIDKIINANYVVMVIVVGLIIPIIFEYNIEKIFGEIYYRILGALGILDGTLSILTMILYKLYLYRHPQEINIIDGTSPTDKPVPKKGLGIFAWLFLFYISAQIIIPIVGYSAWKFSYNRPTVNNTGSISPRPTKQQPTPVLAKTVEIQEYSVFATWQEGDIRYEVDRVYSTPEIIDNGLVKNYFPKDYWLVARINMYDNRQSGNARTIIFTNSLKIKNLTQEVSPLTRSVILSPLSSTTRYAVFRVPNDWVSPVFEFGPPNQNNSLALDFNSNQPKLNYGQFSTNAGLILVNAQP